MAKKAKKSTLSLGASTGVAKTKAKKPKKGNVPPGTGSMIGPPGVTPVTTAPAPPPNASTPLNQVPLSAADNAEIGQYQGAYNTAITDSNQGLYQAAMAYGDQGLIDQYGNQAGIGQAGRVVNPNAALPTIQRLAGESKTNTGKSLNRNNTFFSGIHVDALNKINETAQRNTSEAYLRFKEAEQNFINAKAAAKSELETSITGVKGRRLDQIIAAMMNG